MPLTRPGGFGSRIARWLSSSGAPVTAVTGIRLALEPGRRSVSRRAERAIVGTALSVAAVMASLTFGANLLHLERTPRLTGRTGICHSPPVRRHHAEGFRRIHQVSAAHDRLDLRAARPPQARARRRHTRDRLAPGRGPVLTATMLAGHAPQGNQIVLGTSTLRGRGLRLGQSMEIAVAGRSLRPRLVGRATFPSFGQGSFTPDRSRRGRAGTRRHARRPAERARFRSYNFLLLKFAPGPRNAAEMAAFRRVTARYSPSVDQSTCVLAGQKPDGILYYERINATPLVLASLLAVLGLGCSRSSSSSQPGPGAGTSPCSGPSACDAVSWTRCSVW